MAGRPSRTRHLDVWMNGVLVGQWRLAPQGQRFAYAASWLDDPRSRPLSLSLPLTAGTRLQTGEAVAAFFDNLLPDSDAIRRRLASRYGAASTKPFDLLEKIGRDCVGAVQLLPAGSPSPDVRGISGIPLSEQQIESLLDATVSNAGLGAGSDDDFRISIAGAQEKTALLRHQGQWLLPQGATPTTHILKLPMGRVGNMAADFSTSVENEWLCGEILRAYGLPVARSEVAHFGKYKVLVVERFDRKLMQDGWIARLPQEDFCQVFGISPIQKYEADGGPGMDMILDRLRGSVRAEEDRRNFLKAQLLFWMLAATDGHAKNFSIRLHEGGTFGMTPLYDVMSAWPVIGDGANQLPWKKAKLAMAVRAKNPHYALDEIRRRHWNATAKRNAMGQDFEREIEKVLEQTPKVIAEVTTILPPGFPGKVADAILQGLQGQAEYLASQPTR